MVKIAVERVLTFVPPTCVGSMMANTKHFVTQKLETENLH